VEKRSVWAKMASLLLTLWIVLTQIGAAYEIINLYIEARGWKMVAQSYRAQYEALSRNMGLKSDPMFKCEVRKPERNK
jgi:hypothetical protein